MTRYWRKSSRWRAAVKRAGRSIHYYRLQILARNQNPFDGWAWFEKRMGDESTRVSASIYKFGVTNPFTALMSRSAFPSGMGDVVRRLV